MGTEPAVPARVDALALGRLLRPRSVAVVGASDVTTSVGGAPLALLDRFGFAGEVYPVSPSRDAIGARACLHSIDDLPRGVDAAILAIPRAAVPGALEALSRRGVGGAVVFSSGYAETGPEGAEDQRALAAFARAHGLALAGPNCLGLVNFVDRVPLTFGDASPNRRVRPRGLAIVAQSGAMTLALTYAAMAKDVTVTYAVSTGNEAVVGIEDYLDALADDDATAAVAMLVEQIRRPGEFLAAARRARERGREVLVVHLGRGERARAASLTHTGALAGDYTVTRAALAAEGVVVLESIDELIDLADVVTKCPAPRGRGIGVVTDSGAMKTFSIDVGDALGLSLATLGEDATRALGVELPAFAVAENPVDITATGLNDPSLYARAASVLLDAPEVAGVVLAVMPGSPLQGAQQVGALVPAIAGAAKPVLYAIMGGDCPLPEENVLAILDADVALFRSPERALRALGHLVDLVEAARALDAREPARPGVALHLGDGGPPSEHAAKALLAGVGIAVPAGRRVGDLGDAREAAAALGYPVVLKVSSPDVVHKAAVGGVAVVAEPSALASAYDGLLARVRRAAPEARVEGVLVEEVLSGGVEAIVSARRDPTWGVVAVVGSGGAAVESARDVAVVGAAAGRAEVRRALEGLELARALSGGAVPLDVEALVTMVSVLARTLEASDELDEIELNPVLVREAGRGVVALDAVIVPRARSL